MITNQKLKKSLEEIKNITSFDAILYSAKGKHLTGTVEEPNIATFCEGVYSIRRGC